MKKTFFYLFVILFATTGITAIAQEGGNGARNTTETPGTVEMKQQEKAMELEQKRAAEQERMEAKKADEQERVAEKKAQMEERKAEFTERVMEKKQLAGAFAERMQTRLHTAVNRLSKIADRIESHIKKLDSAKFDTSVATANIATARTQIMQLNADIDSAFGEMQEILNMENPKPKLEALRTNTKEIVVRIKETHALLVEAVTSLKAQQRTEEQTEEGTADTSTN